MRLMRILTATAAAGLILLAGATPATARPATRPGGGLSAGHLIRQHDCVRYDRPMAPPIAGYLVRDTASPSKGLFYRDSGAFTAGMIVGHGGTLKLEWKCRK